MGQAKQRRAAELAYAKQNAEKFLLPPTAAEASLVQEIAGLPVERVRRLDVEELLARGMRPGHCHTNASKWEERYPKQLAMISGWTLRDGMFVFHSVVEEQGQLMCVTPTDDDDEYFDFVRDRKISWVEGDAYFGGA